MIDEEREAQILTYIHRFQQAYPGLSPSYREIAAAVDLRSTSTVFYHLRRLAAQGKIEMAAIYQKHHGIGLADTVMVTQADASRLGIDWNQLLVLKYAGRKALKDAGIRQKAGHNGR
jgi:SOS-response transcriptional repressor LexA